MKQNGPVWPHSPFWQFSIEFYAAPGVQEACLSLQNEQGLDVNLVLLSAWLARVGRPIEPALVEPLQTASARHQLSIMQPLRQARRSLDPSAAEPWLAPHIAEQRRTLLTVELHLERVEQLQLERLVERTATRARRATDGLFLDNLLMLYPRISPTDANLRGLAEQIAQPAAEMRTTLKLDGNRQGTNKTCD